MAEKKYDVLVIGAGIAGMVSANRAAQLGMSVLVLEKGEEELYLCNTRYTGGAFHLCFRDSSIAPPDEIEAAIMASTSGWANRPLALSIIENAPRLISWLSEEGIRFMKASGAEYHNRTLAPPRPNQAGLHWQGRSGDVFLRTMLANLQRRGGTLQRGSRAVGIELDAASGVRVRVLQNGEEKLISANAVVIADGGIQGNPDLLRKYIAPHPEKIFQRGAGTAIGDGLQMAQALGAASIGLECFYGHLLSRDVLTVPGLWPYPVLDIPATAGVVVGADGKRLVDEGEGGVFIANTVARLEDPQSTAAIFDDAIWNGPAAEGMVSPNPYFLNGGGKLVTAGSIAELAGKLGVPAPSLVATIDGYNTALASGQLASLSPPRRTDLHRAYPIKSAPFHAAPICPGITYSMGGLVIDASSQVLKPDGSPIPGVYAAGTTTGGLEGGPRVGYVGGLVKSGVTALKAAEKIAATLGRAA